MTEEYCPYKGNLCDLYFNDRLIMRPGICRKDGRCELAKDITKKIKESEKKGSY